MADIPETQYATTADGTHVAYQVFGEGPRAVLFVPMWWSHVEVMWEQPELAAFLRRLASFARVVVFDKRGTGLSDPLPPDPVSIVEQWADDALAVVEAVGLERVTVIGMGAGAPTAITFAAMHPARMETLVLVNAFAEPIRVPDELAASYASVIHDLWGTGAELAVQAPSRADDLQLRAWWGRYQRFSVPPGVHAVWTALTREIDIRGVVGAVNVPTLILHGAGVRDITVAHGRYLAEAITGATYIELDSEDRLWFVGDTQMVLDEIETFVTGARPQIEVDRMLATVLFTDIASSTERLNKIGDRPWRDLLGRFRSVVRQQLHRYRGREINTRGDDFLAVFDGPSRALRCAIDIGAAAAALGLEVRTGLHIGEVELMDDDIGGIAVHVGARIAALAAAGEILVSRTIVDLSAGSGIEFEHRGDHNLKGIDGTWHLYAVRD